jgi:hypothetical protein
LPQAPDVASDIHVLFSFLEIVEIAGNLAKVDTLLIDLINVIYTLIPISSKSSRLQAEMSL